MTGPPPLAMPWQRAHTLLSVEVPVTETNSQSVNTRDPRIARGRTDDSAMRGPRRLPDKPWKYNPPAPPDAVRPKPVVVPKAK